MSDALVSALARLIIEKDTPVVLVLDKLNPDEQRVVSYACAGVRELLQPWSLAVAKPGYLRIVYSGTDGYTVPCGATMQTLRLDRFSQQSALDFISEKLRRVRKHIATRFLKSLVSKEHGTTCQYLTVAIMALADMWGYEQLNGHVDDLPGTLTELYQVNPKP
jgi:hypothetical protein